MKKKIVTLVTILLISVFCISFASCNDVKDDVKTGNLSGNLSFVIAESDSSYETFLVDLSNFNSNQNVEDVIVYLYRENRICYKSTHGAYGLYLTAMGTMTAKEDGSGYTEKYLLNEDKTAGKYIYAYTSVVANQDTSNWKSTKDFNGTTLVSSAVGVSSMNIEDGATIYFTLYTY